MFLSKQYRGQGIGQQMLDTALDFAKKAGYSKVFLYNNKGEYGSRPKIVDIKTGVSYPISIYDDLKSFTNHGNCIPWYRAINKIG